MAQLRGKGCRGREGGQRSQLYRGKPRAVGIARGIGLAWIMTDSGRRLGAHLGREEADPRHILLPGPLAGGVFSGPGVANVGVRVGPCWGYKWECMR